jgi:predicted DNA-binding transcriptional regulator AlpA
MSIQQTLDEANAHMAKAFTLIADAMEAMSTTEDLQMLTVDETATLLNRSRSTIYVMCKDGRLCLIDDRIPRWVVKDYVAGKRQAKTKRRTA